MSAQTPDLVVRVARKWREAEGIAGFELVPAGGGGLPPFSAGAHIDVHLAEGLIRQYSLCNAPSDAQSKAERYQIRAISLARPIVSSSWSGPMRAMLPSIIKTTALTSSWQSSLSR